MITEFNFCANSAYGGKKRFPGEQIQPAGSSIQDTIPVVDSDSRLGWEPSMEYMCDPWHLEWKVRQINSMFREIETYRGCLMLGKPEK